MSIDYPRPCNDGSTDFKTQRTEQSEFDFNGIPIGFSTVGNINYNPNQNSNIPRHDDGKFVLDTSANETLKIKVTPSDGKKTVVQIIKRDDSSVLECNTLQIGAVVKNNDDIPDNYEGEGKFHLYKHLINKDKPFRRSFSPSNRVSSQSSLDDYHSRLIKKASTYSKSSNCECCLTSSAVNEHTSDPSCVNVSNQPPLLSHEIEKLYATQSISNNASFKILYNKPYAASEFDDSYLINKAESHVPEDNSLIKCVKSVISDAAKALQCFMCGEAFSTCGTNIINAFTTCSVCSMHKKTKLKPVEICPSCRSDNSFADKIVPTVSNHYEVLGPNIYRICNSPSESSILSSDYQLVPFKLKESMESDFTSINEQILIPSTSTSIDNKLIPVVNWYSPSKYLSYCTCLHKSQDNGQSINPLDGSLQNIDALNKSGSYPLSNPITPIPHQSPSNNFLSPIHTCHSPTSTSGFMAEAISMQQSISPSTTRTHLSKVDPQLIKDSLKHGSAAKVTKNIVKGIIETQQCKFDNSQHISFNKIVKYPHVLLTIDNIRNVEHIDRVLITSGNFVLNYKDLCIKGLRIPTVKLDQNYIKVVFEISPSTTAASRLLIHCGIAQKKKFYYVDLPLDLTDPAEISGDINLSLHGSTDTNELDECNKPKLTYKIRKFIQGLYYMTSLPSLQSKFQYVSLYGDQLDELVASIVNNIPSCLCSNISKQMDGSSYSYVINGIPSKLKFAGDIFVQNDYYQGKLTNYLQQSKSQIISTPMSYDVCSVPLFELPLFVNLLQNVFAEWTKFVMPAKNILFHAELITALKAHATAMIEELLIRLIEYLDGPILRPNFNKYLAPPLIHYDEDTLDIDNNNNKGLFSYLWHVDSCKSLVGNIKLVCRVDPPVIKDGRKMDSEDIPQIALVELSDVYNTADGLRIVNNVIEMEVQRILSLKNGHNDFIASIEVEIKRLMH